MSYRLESPSGDIIYFDNVSYAILRDTLAGLAAYPVDYATTAPPGYIGEVINTATITPRTISLSVLILGAGRAELERNRLRLVNALSPINGQCRFVWTAEDGQGYYLDITPADGSPDFSVGTAPNATEWPCKIDLIAHDPCWHSITQMSIEIIGRHDRFVLPFDPGRFIVADDARGADITNTGTVSTPVTITLHGALGSPISISNDTTGETITVRQDIDVQETLIIDTSDDNLGVTLIDASGHRSDALHRCTIGSQFWQLVPGVNRISYDVGSQGFNPSGTLSYRPRWLSR